MLLFEFLNCEGGGVNPLIRKNEVPPHPIYVSYRASKKARASVEEARSQVAVASCCKLSSCFGLLSIQ